MIKLSIYQKGQIFVLIICFRERLKHNYKLRINECDTFAFKEKELGLFLEINNKYLSIYVISRLQEIHRCKSNLPFSFAIPYFIH